MHNYIDGLLLDAYKCNQQATYKGMLKFTSVTV